MRKRLYFVFIISVSLFIWLFASCGTDETTGPGTGGGDPAVNESDLDIPTFLRRKAD